ncbi:DNA/RNA polymerase [Zopfia rhizophila CBS 207.26]|uniref:DNA-directed RNA polymerase n=1 Tax=Zopfia rhizophila CBS 207.26 TaxID=1314779 RepID=A0A6A6DKM8_9PEZI|nr:DNA/RNA polymerase [Zopfia rhizophila CBS 207.26]
MLARAARRKLRRDAFKNSTTLHEQLTLPWLCPAQMRWAASVGTVSPNRSPEFRRQRLPSSLSPRNETRSLATSADILPPRYDAIPFDGLMPSWNSRTTSPELSSIPQWDPSKPLIINNSLSASAPVAKMKFGIGGDPAELHQNLHACLRVGRMDRAAAIVHRLTDMYNPSAPEVVDAHNVYLRTLFEIAEQNPSASSMENIENWYDKEMVRNGVEPNGQTLVTLLRASMAFLQGNIREMSIRKYLDMAQKFGPTTFEEVNSSPEFSEDEWDTLIRFQPEFFEEPPSMDEVQEIQISTPEGRAIAIQHGLIQDPLLRVKPVPQKGLGLKSLKEALRSFEPGKGVPFPDEMDVSGDEKAKAYAYMRQIRLEENAIEAATERWKAEDAKLQELGIHGVLNSKPMQALMWQWYSALLPLIQKEIKATKEVVSNPTTANQSDERHIYGPYLEMCSAEKLAAVTIQDFVMASVGDKGREAPCLKIASITLQIANHVEKEVNAESKRRQILALRKQRKCTRAALLPKLWKQNSPFDSSSLLEPSQAIPLDTLGQKRFPEHVKTRIGALLLERMLRTATISVTRDDPKTGKKVTSVQPAFSHSTGFQNGKKVGLISPHYEIQRKLRTEPVFGVQTVRLPMLVEPKPWTGYREGGYYSIPEAIVRQKSGDEVQQAYTISAIENGDMEKLMKGLDTLGKVPWNINGDVYRVMVQAWNSGEGLGGLVPEEFKAQRPQEPEAGAPYQERMKWMRKVKAYENEKSGLHSQRCFQNFQLEVARSYLNETFYYPHSVDFRGRAYPIPPLLNHIGADLARSLLKFANGKELGTVGLQWLKIHLANLYGFDKASLRDREQFAMENINEIYDSATNPLDGNRWWAKAEDPWQCLACCIELKNALDSPDPTRFVSHLPIHQDGTCNGLQHYAALGGDKAGASQVNLEPSDKPQDIYTGVAELVKEMVAEDAKKDNPLAKFLDGKITRRVVKRTVMTNVYGVTFVGAKLQVLGELEDMFPQFEEQEGVPSLIVLASYIAMKIFKALGKIFNGAQEIQYWLGECADRITTSITAEQIRRIESHLKGDVQMYHEKYKAAKKTMAVSTRRKLQQNLSDFKSSVIWTTPLKMPVVQPYRKTKTQSVKTSLQAITITKPHANDSVSKRKQLQAFPPNFIHSLDATHMILSALKCNEMGLDFAAVHDSFWTHAADIPNLNTILRDAFVRMHSEDIIGRLAAEFKARYAGSMYRANLISSSPVAQQIQAWRKLQRGGVRSTDRYGSATMEEVAMEAERQRLLNSEDPEQRKKGEEMVTPTSIYLANKDPLALQPEATPAVLGAMTRGKNMELKQKVLKAEAEAVGAPTDTKAQECFTAAEEDVEAEAEADEELEEEVGEEGTQEPRHKPLKKSNSQKTKIQVWLPVTFPPVPKKGDFDVKRLRESKYFFS